MSFSCPICHKSFTLKHHLKRHVSKKFTCSQIQINTQKNIIVKSFGSEITDYINSKFIEDILRSTSGNQRFEILIPLLVSHIYFNDNFPYNHTVKISTDNTFAIIINNISTPVHKHKVFQDIIMKCLNIIESNLKTNFNAETCKIIEEKCFDEYIKLNAVRYYSQEELNNIKRTYPDNNDTYDILLDAYQRYEIECNVINNLSQDRKERYQNVIDYNEFSSKIIKDIYKFNYDSTISQLYKQLLSSVNGVIKSLSPL